MELSFKNDQSIKDALIFRMDKHIEMDDLMQGATGSNGKGCTVWCALNNGDLHKGYNHSAFPDVLGLPEWLARLHDTIFEGLTPEDSKQFSRDWVRAVPVGKDLERVKWQFTSFILKENIERVLTLDISEELKSLVLGAIRGSLKLSEDALVSGVWDRSAAMSAESAAWSAASAARSAASAAMSASMSAAWSAAMSAESAAWSAASAAWSAARSAASAAMSAAYKRYADELLRLFIQL